MNLQGVKVLNKIKQNEIFGGDNHDCYCFFKGTFVLTPCDGTCPNGTQPFCP